MKFLLNTISLGAAALVATSALAQVAVTEATQRPSTSLINITTSTPRLPPNGGSPTMMLKVSSLTGQPLPIAVLMGKDNWSAYSSTGAICHGNAIGTQGVPWYSPADGRLDGPPGIQAGVKSPALIPVTLCYNLKRGDEISISLVLYAIKDGRPMPQQFSFSRLVIQ